MFGSRYRAAARPACRQHVLLHRLGVQLLLKRSGFGIGRDRWCIRVRGCGATCVALAHREPWSDWPAAAGAASTADTAGPFSADVQHGRSSSPHVRDELLQVIVGDVLVRAERVPPWSSKAAVYERTARAWRGRCDGLRHLWAADKDRPTVKLAV